MEKSQTYALNLDRNDIINAYTHNMGDIPQHYDLIVVGAGIIGNALAVTFAKQGRKVLLIGM